MIKAILYDHKHDNELTVKKFHKVPVKGEEILLRGDRTAIWEVDKVRQDFRRNDGEVPSIILFLSLVDLSSKQEKTKEGKPKRPKETKQAEKLETVGEEE